MPRLFLQPEVASELHRCGLRAFADFFAHGEGEIIGGHRTRNVARVQTGPMRGFLKREYHTPLKDYFESWWAGWGFVSKSVREARTLQALRASGIDCPRPLAAGEENGQAFLLVEEMSECTDLATHLRAQSLSRADRLGLARQLGEAISNLHTAGFTHPDLYAKHVFVDGGGRRIAFIDVQRTRRLAHVSWRRRWLDLAALDASLAHELVPARDRLSFLRAYLHHAVQEAIGRRTATPPWRTLLRSAVDGIAQRTRRLLTRRKVRRMRGLEPSADQRLVVEYWRVAVRDETRTESAETPVVEASTRRWPR